MRRILYGLIITTTLLPASLRAQDAISLSLQDAMDFAVKNNVTAKNARLDVLIQKAKNAEVTGIALPQIKGEGKFTQFTDPQVSFFPATLLDAFNPPGTPPSPPGSFIPVTFTPVYATSATVSGSQILFDGSVMVALQARKAIIKLTEQSAQNTEEDIRYNVQKAYYAFVIAKKQYGILKSSLANARGILNDINALKDAGFAEKIEVDRMTVQVNNLATDSIRIGSMINLSEQVLKYRMGMDINQPIVLSDTMVENNFTIARQLLADDVNYNNRTEYSLLQTQLQLNKYDLKRHHLSGLPSLALFGSAGYNYSSNEFNELLKWRKNYIFTTLWGVSLNVPIFDGLQRRSRVQQARLNVEKTKNNIDNLKLGIDFQTQQSKTTLKNSLLTLENQQRNTELANSVLDLARRKYKEGVGSNIEVTQAQTEYLQAQNNYFQAQLDVINSQADLQKALGQFK
jgi:outer membrane protein